jgi:hypothetical protein
VAPQPNIDQSFTRQTTRLDGTLPSFYGGAGTSIGFILSTYSAPTTSINTAFLAPRFPPMALAGQASLGGADPVRTVFAPYLVFNGRVDSAGRPLEDIAVSVWPQGGDPFSIIAPAGLFTDANAEFYPNMVALATENHAVVLFRERPYWTEIRDGVKEYVPKFWAMRFESKNLESPALFDVTAPAFEDYYFPLPSVGGVIIRNNFTEFNDQAALANMRWTVLPNNRFLVSFSLRVFDTENVYRTRIVRFDISSGITAEVVREVESEAFIPTLEGYAYPSYTVQSMIHLGEGWVLAKECDGGALPDDVYGTPPLITGAGRDYAVRFILSQDGGSTWSEFEPAGFHAPLLNQHFGDFAIRTPRVDGQHGSILINARDVDRGAYYTYESQDSGLTWLRRAKIANGPSQPMDGLYANEANLGGAYLRTNQTFRTLTPGPDFVNPVDRTLPNRFKGAA